MITFMDSKDSGRGTEKCLDPQLWHACAGSIVQMPPLNSKVFYFPQGHAEHASGNVPFGNSSSTIPSYIPCRFSGIKYMADPDTDEVFAKIRLLPVSGNDSDFDGDGEENDVAAADNSEKPASFAKTLTQSDANNGGGFSVPRYCAETIFPRLDYSADPPVQTILVKDVHGETWKFRHIYRGTPRRHLLTTGWSTFVNHKKLVAGDSIVFLRAENGDLCVGIRRAKRGIGGGAGVEASSGWNPVSGGSCVVPPYGGGGFSSFLREDENKSLMSGRNNGSRKVKAESVIEATDLAVNGKVFEVIYYPRASTPEFCVKANVVKAALQIRWCTGLRFKMAFETEDSSRISWFMGTISAVQVADPLHWPDSPWRLLQVTWDEPDLLQNVKRVSPWLVELVSNMSAMHLSPFSPPRKKIRLPQNLDFPFDGPHPIPAAAYSTNHHHLVGPNGPFGCLPGNNTPHLAGMQGARHSQYGLSLSDLHLNNKQVQFGFFPVGFHQLHHSAARPTSSPTIYGPTVNKSDDISCLLTMGNSSPRTLKKKSDAVMGRKAPLILFGKAILTEQQISLNVSPIRSGNSSSSSDGNKFVSDCGGFPFEPNLETGHCKVYVDSNDKGRTLDLSLLESYEKLNKKLADMFGIENSEVMNHVLYRDVTGAVRHLGDEPFSEFMKTARRLKIIMDSRSSNDVVGAA
ncbi:unnamed protein product [Cuscuta epithymum]|uniref:Auxin response factor n=1 Tax=Cuscuta epithymum TaxID=186058 RepID=A0AAV0DJU8_9ASTE|nr:unnamed protein product [Cuscuta epithymum]